MLETVGLRLSAIGLDRAGRRRQERRHAIVAGRRPQLAGQPHIGRRTDPRQHLLLLRRGRRQAVAILAADAHAAGRAAAASAADRGMGNAGKAAHFEDRESGRLHGAAPIAVVQAHDPAASFPEVAQRPRAQHADEQRQCRRLELRRKWRRDWRRRRAAAHGRERTGSPGSRAAGRGRRRHAGRSPRRRCRRPEPVARRHRARAAQARYQGLRRHAKCSPMQACSQTTRGSENWRAIADPVAGDQRSQDPGIARLHTVQLMRQARADDMQRAQGNDQRAQDPLRPFPARELEGAPPVERPQGQEEVTEQRSVEHRLADRIVPDGDEPLAADFEHAQRDQAKRMIEKVGDDIEEEDVARPESKPSDHDAISEAAAPLRAAGRSQRACPRRRRAAAAGSGVRRSPWRCRPCRDRPSSFRAS